MIKTGKNKDMVAIKKSAKIIGGVFSLLIGEDVDTSTSKEIKNNLYLYILDY